MSVSERPQLRPFLAAAQDERDPRYMIVWDRLGLGSEGLRMTAFEFGCLQLFDGCRTLREIQSEAMRQAGGQILPLEIFATLLRKVDEALFLEGPRFREKLSHPVREPSCIGCYAGEPEALRHQMCSLFTAPGGPGPPREPQPDGRLRAVLVPHIDYARGGVTYAWGFKDVFERTDAALFVIIGTSHYSAHRFTLTRKDFKTPLGIVPTDQTYIDRLVAHYGDGLFDDELCHLPEHSIELEVVLLQYLYEGRRPFRIVPLVVGSFQDAVEARISPLTHPDIARMVAALRRVEAETPEPICYLISGDLAHIGPKFGDAGPVQPPFLHHSRQQDLAVLEQTRRADALGYFHTIAAEGDRRRICGLPPTFVVLEAFRPGSGRVLHYYQYVHPHGHESVSFASVSFER
jgi:hypothetical protein